MDDVPVVGDVAMVAVSVVLASAFSPADLWKVVRTLLLGRVPLWRDPTSCAVTAAELPAEAEETADRKESTGVMRTDALQYSTIQHNTAQQPNIVAYQKIDCQKMKNMMYCVSSQDMKNHGLSDQSYAATQVVVHYLCR